jgi:flagellin-like protein
MKKIWKKRKNSEAVSPVIATILMVAITVVLAAVLYVMVMGFGTSGQNTPTGSFSGATSLSTTSEKVQFGVITPDAKVADIKIILTDNGGATVLSATLATTTMTGTGTVTGILTQLGGTANKVASGDYLTLSGLTAASGTYTVSMVFIPTGNIIGVATTFTK